MSSISTSPVSVPIQSKGVKASDRRVGGLDSIRFTCAFIVVIGHLGFIPGRLHGEALGGAASKMLAGLFNCLFNGPAAVIVFFLISGFCIHFPYRDGRKVNVGVFYLRRFVRIGLPVLGAAAILQFILHTFAPLETVGWSIICEAIYYLLYPALLLFGRRFGWGAAILVSGICTSLMLATHFHSLSNGAYGYPALGLNTWVVGLPVWLMGCWLAENYASLSIPSVASMWAMRGGLYALSVAGELWRFHAPRALASNCIILDLFAIPACYWLGKEIAFASTHSSSRPLEWAGLWSYSLYLVHPMTGFIMIRMGVITFFSSLSTHFLLLFAALLFSYGFYLLIERPSHRLSNKIGKYFRKVDGRPAMAAVVSS